MRWILDPNGEGREGTVPEIDVFLDEIHSVCLRHGLSIEHEDGEGAFNITNYNGWAMEHLLGANDGRAI
jgi:hypothetical protein